MRLSLAQIFESRRNCFTSRSLYPVTLILLGGSSNEFLAQLGLMQEALVLEGTLTTGGELGKKYVRLQLSTEETYPGVSTNITTS